MVLVTSPSKNFKTLRDLVSTAKARPGELNFASAGIGSASHFAVERLRLSAGIEAQHIPFKGASEGLTEVLAGRVDFFFVPVGPALSLVKEGKLIALAVSTPQRSSVLPQVPTTIEAGFTASTYDLWVGLFLPARTPRHIVAKLHQETERALRVHAVRERLAMLGVEPMPMTLDEVDRYFKDDVEAHVRLVKSANIVAQK
jgi:tripartite-type tricarboxylate transporter receptor subunit TctC